MKKIANKIGEIDISLENIKHRVENLVSVYSNPKKYIDIDMYEDIKEEIELLKSELDMYSKEFSFLIRIIDKIITKKQLTNKLEFINKTFNKDILNIDRSEINKKFLELKKIDLNEFFNDIEGKSLDNNQREIILKDEINNLVVAAAGSGKTTTIVGKVKYLIEHNNYLPNDLLVLSFTKKSALEMKERIKNSVGCDVDVMTFHKLGLNILSEVNKSYPKISEKELSEIIEELVIKLLEDEEYACNFNTFYSNYMYEYKSQFEFDSLEEYIGYLSRNKMKTLDGKRLRSLEEIYIANFLYMHGIKYEYERKYPNYNGYYKPDFYLPQYDIYIEHFGIDKNGNVPSFFEGDKYRDAKVKYNDGIEWKRKLHKQHDTKLIETYSYEMKQGILFDNLRKNLIKSGVKVEPKDSVELFLKIREKNEGEYNSILKLISGFVTYMRSNNIDLKVVKSKANEYKDINILNRANLFIQLIEPIIDLYIKKLSKDEAIDFSDMINLAIDDVREMRYISRYKYIIIDEYQDISLNRLELIKSLKQQNKAKLFCVGDDWQSIYKFTGSEVDLFINFEKYIGYTEISKIEKTYRYNQRIAELSGKFIQKNELQVKKDIKSNSYKSEIDKEINNLSSNSKLTEQEKVDIAKKNVLDVKKSIHLEYITNKSLIKNKVIDLLRTFPRDTSVILLGRYGFDIKGILDGDILKRAGDSIKFRERDDLSIRFFTAHGAKGLEADNVIILNTSDGLLGFPSNIEDDPLYELIKTDKEVYTYAEERRLFYVAITRTKNNVFLIVNSFEKSPFIIELEKEYGYKNIKKELKCPKCSADLALDVSNKGIAFRCKSNQCNFIDENINDYELNSISKCKVCGGEMKIRNGYSIFYGCSNYPYCNHVEQLQYEKYDANTNISEKHEECIPKLETKLENKELSKAVISKSNRVIQNNISDEVDVQKYKNMTIVQLGESNDINAIKYVAQYLKSDKYNDKRNAASAMGKLAKLYKEECMKYKNILIELIYSERPQIRQYTLKSLKEFDLSENDKNKIRAITLNEDKEYNKVLIDELLCTNDNTKAKYSDNNISNILQYDKEDLLNDLKNLRKEIADNSNVPAYYVFHDKSLIEMCEKIPTTKEEFLSISGVGEIKYSKYGNIFINKIKETIYSCENL